jgi:RNA polymerase sigma factor (TIGR02999 family)
MEMPADEPGVPQRVAELVLAANAGDSDAAGKLFSILYEELRRVAARQLRIGAPNATMGATTLLHECYLDISGRSAEFPTEGHFLAYASRAMRGLIVDHIRDRSAIKRGGEFVLTTLDTQIEDSIPLIAETARLSDALTELEQVDAPLAELVDLKYFCGFSFTEIASMRAVSERTVQRDWQKARMYLHQALVE